MSAPQLARKFSLSQAKLKELLHYDPETGEFTHRTSHAQVIAGQRAGFMHKRGYWQVCADGITVKAHQAAWFYMTGEWPSDQVDHKDQNKANNRWGNLRLATNAENCRNVTRNKRNSTGVRGVIYQHRAGRNPEWVASIRFNRKLIHLGIFRDLASAAAARRSAEIKFFGEFAPVSVL